jgi:hypothetical protein
LLTFDRNDEMSINTKHTHPASFPSEFYLLPAFGIGISRNKHDERLV